MFVRVVSGRFLTKSLASGSLTIAMSTRDHTLLHHGADGLHMRGMKTEELSAIVSCINVEKAECVRKEDLEMIKANIIRHHHSFTAFDVNLKLQLMLDPLSYKVGVSARELKFVPLIQVLITEFALFGRWTFSSCLAAAAGLSGTGIQSKSSSRHERTGHKSCVSWPGLAQEKVAFQWLS